MDLNTPYAGYSDEELCAMSATGDRGAEEALVKSTAMDQAYVSYILADASKFGRVSAVTVALCWAALRSQVWARITARAALSRTLQARFEEAGFLVVQTRPTEAGLYGAATQGYKRRDMQRRAEIIRESAPAAVISVHQNFFSLSSRRGAQVFFREGNERSRTLACAIQTALNAMPECVRPADALRGDYYVLNCSDYASVIVECGFLSNAADEALLVTEAYRARLADTICAGTLAYLAAASSGEGAFG